MNSLCTIILVVALVALHRRRARVIASRTLPAPVVPPAQEFGWAEAVGERRPEGSPFDRYGLR